MRMTDSKLEKLGVPDSDHRSVCLYIALLLITKYLITISAEDLPIRLSKAAAIA